MESYICYFGKSIENIKHNICWADLRYDRYTDVTKIYISNFTQSETKQYLSLIVSTINQITPCKVIEKNRKMYIKYTLLKRYDNDLILLNFIRNLWHEPFYNYSKNFFEFLSKSIYKDPLKRLTSSNIKACALREELDPYNDTPGHSNVHLSSTLKIKTVKELQHYTGNSTRDFLTK